MPKFRKGDVVKVWTEVTVGQDLDGCIIDDRMRDWHLKGSCGVTPPDTPSVLYDWEIVRKANPDLPIRAGDVWDDNGRKYHCIGDTSDHLRMFRGTARMYEWEEVSRFSDRKGIKLEYRE